jgi:hypothetical protein
MTCFSQAAVVLPSGRVQVPLMGQGAYFLSPVVGGGLAGKWGRWFFGTLGNRKVLEVYQVMLCG